MLLLPHLFVGRLYNIYLIRSHPCDGREREINDKLSCVLSLFGTGARDFIGLDEVSKIEFLVPLFAETLGTMMLVFIGCASCIPLVVDKTPTVIQIAFTFGLAVASLAQVSILEINIIINRMISSDLIRGERHDEFPPAVGHQLPWGVFYDTTLGVTGGFQNNS